MEYHFKNVKILLTFFLLIKKIKQNRKAWKLIDGGERFMLD